MNGKTPYKTTFLIFGTACGAVLILSVLVCFLNASGIIIDLDGIIGKIDHQEKWNDLDIVSSFLYTIGDYCCHQETARSLIFNENQMPMCIRETFLFLGMAIGFLLLSQHTYLPPKERFVLYALLILLTPVEWGIEHYLGLGSSIIRAIVSVISGFAFAGFLSAILEVEYRILSER